MRSLLSNGDREPVVRYVAALITLRAEAVVNDMRYRTKGWAGKEKDTKAIV